MAKRRRSRRYSGFGGVFGEVFSEGFGALPLLLGIPLVKVALAGGAAYYFLKKKPVTVVAPAPVLVSPPVAPPVMPIIPATPSPVPVSTMAPPSQVFSINGYDKGSY